MTKEQYFEMLETIGEEPVEDQIPIEITDFLIETQNFIQIYNLLPSRWDGFSGAYMGKDMTNISALFDCFGIEGEDLKLIAFVVFSHLDNINTQRVNKKIEEKSRSGSKKGSSSRSK